MNWFKTIFNLQNKQDLISLCQQHHVTVKEMGNGLIGLNYHQLDSSSHSYFAGVCRGLVLDNDLNVIARPFQRFFNLHENFTDKIVPNLKGKLSIAEKADGSLIKVFFYQGKWQVHTRNSDGSGKVSRNGISFNINFQELTKLALTGQKIKDILPNNVNPILYLQENKPELVDLDNQFQQWAQEENLNPNFTYLFELCSPFNSPVVDYQDIVIYFLGSLNNYRQFNDDINRAEVSDLLIEYAKNNQIKQYCDLKQKLIEADTIANGSNIYHDFKSDWIKSTATDIQAIDDIATVLNKYKGNELEGFIICINDVPLAKIKSLNYITLHQLGSKEISLNDLWKIVAVGEENEIASYFPHLQTKLNELTQKRNNFLNNMDNIVKKVVKTMNNESYVVNKNYVTEWEKAGRKKEMINLILQLTDKAFMGYVIAVLKGENFSTMKVEQRIKLLKQL